MSKSFWAIIAVIVVVFGGILVFNKNEAKAPSDGSSSGKPTEHIRGTSTLGLTMVEYGDFQCPYCSQFYPVVKQVEQKYDGKIKFQFRNLPLIQAHKNAFAAARAAEAAGLQDKDKYWGMFDLLYENQSAWSDQSNASAVFESYAAQLSLNVDQFKKDSASSKVGGMINADVEAFTKTGFEKSTPTFILDGKLLQPKSITVDAFSKVIDPIIAKKQKDS